MSSRMVEIPADVLTSVPADHKFASRSKIYAVIAAIALAVSVALEFTSGPEARGQFFFSYLVAFMYFLSLALGGLFFVILQFVAKAGWSVVVRRTAENVMATLPVLAVLVIPVLVGAGVTHHHWFHPEHADALLEHKRPWLNPIRFWVFAGIYFALWIGLATYFRRRSVAQDRTGDQALTRQCQKMAAPAVAIFALSLTFASIDWVMSLDPHWYSTMFGVYYFAGSTLGGFALIIVLLQNLQNAGLIKHVVSKEHYHDLGKFLFGFVVFWTYIAFSQYFLIWYANLPEETIWYQNRLAGGWSAIAIFMMIGHFFLPFFYLLPRTTKRIRITLYLGAAWVLFVHYVDLYWVIMPIHHPDFHPTLLDLTCFIGIGAAFLATYTYFSARDALVPLKDPRLAESLAFETSDLRY